MKKTLICVAIAICCITVLCSILVHNSNERTYNKALEFKEYGEYDKAISAFSELKNYHDCKEQINESNYLKAISLKESNNFDDAISTFEKLGNYKDCTEQIIESNYLKAILLKENNNFDDAISVFEELGEYKDCSEQIMDSRYLKAIFYMEKEEYDKAISLFRKTSEYKRTNELFVKCIKEKCRNTTIGDYITFGHCKQSSNKYEDIEWLVLDKKDNNFLIISKYVIDSRAYNNELENVTWETCTIREWLNKSFLSFYFSEEEISLVKETRVKADSNPECNTDPGNDTIDKVFLLSAKEANKYFSSDEERRCVPTDYATKRGVITSKKCSINGQPTCNWWLRTPGYDQSCAVEVSGKGTINFDYGEDVYYEDNGMRPAMWICLE